MSSIFSFENTSVAPDPKFFLKKVASVPNAAAVNPNGIKMFLANGVSTLFINDKPADINDLRKLRKLRNLRS